jgi:ribosome-binding protein aMBF1 (putative translation factor)
MRPTGFKDLIISVDIGQIGTRDISPMPTKPHSKRKKTVRNSVGKTVAKFRRALGLTQAGLAVKAQLGGWDISAATIEKIEIGHREVTDIDLRKLAKALRVPAALLLE